MKNIAVFFGGVSVEHDVSVITGVLTVNSLDRQKYCGVPIYVHTDGNWYTGDTLKDLDNYKTLNVKKLQRVILQPADNHLYQVKEKGHSQKLKPLCSLACVINCMHGERGEDGALAGLIEMSGIPFASPNLLASSVSMNKTATKTFLKAINVPTVQGVTLSSTSQIDLALSRLNFPMIVKPECGGSSIGITVAKDENELKKGISFALRFGEKAVIENALQNFIEINCSAYKDGLGNVKVSACERPFSTTDVLTFEDKYVNGKRQFPADISPKIAKKIQQITAKVYRALDFCGVIRIDYFLQEDKVYLNEINSVPGSLAYYLFCDTLKEFTVMLNGIIENAIARAMANQTLVKNYSSKILSFSGCKGAKRL